MWVFGQLVGMSDQEINQVTNGMGGVQLEEDLEGELDMEAEEEDEEEELPRFVIVTGVDDAVFENGNVKAQFEEAFTVFCSPHSAATFQYLKSFRRARVVYQEAMDAARARIQMHEAEVCGKRIKCYFAQPIKGFQKSQPHLQPPKPDKQFLISPPASPPVGWEPHHEGVPVVNYDLISALAHLAPGESHTLHAPTEKLPGIVVHVCENPTGYDQRPQITQTRRPDMKS